MPGKIFINYRRGDDPGNTGRLFDRLQEAFQPDQLFMDVDSIKPGLDFVKVLEEQVSQCDVVLAVIGQSWTQARDEAGERRLDNPEDFVRIEIASALVKGKRVIPVLVGEARMPRSDELPEALKPLARRHAVRLTHERFRADTQGLVKALQEALEEADAPRRVQMEAARQAAADAEQDAALRRAKAERKRHEGEAEPRTEEARGEAGEAQERKRVNGEGRRREAEDARRQAEDRRLVKDRVGWVVGVFVLVLIGVAWLVALDARREITPPTAGGPAASLSAPVATAPPAAPVPPPVASYPEWAARFDLSKVAPSFFTHSSCEEIRQGDSVCESIEFVCVTGITQAASLVGKNVAAPTALHPDVKRLGANPRAITATEIYAAIQRGVVVCAAASVSQP